VEGAFVVGGGPERIKILELTRPNSSSYELGPWALFSWVDPPIIIIIDRCRNPHPPAADERATKARDPQPFITSTVDADNSSCESETMI
jgi:hypothetical protein